jgi:hypothetical protein
MKPNNNKNKNQLQRFWNFPCYKGGGREFCPQPAVRGRPIPVAIKLAWLKVLS